MKPLRPLAAKHGLLVALAFCASLPYGMHAAGSLLAGGGIQVLNLLALERSVRLITGTAPSAAGRGSLGIAMTLMRLLLLLVLVVVVLSLTDVHRLAFGAGLIVSIPAVLWHGLQPAQRGS